MGFNSGFKGLISTVGNQNACRWSDTQWRWNRTKVRDNCSAFWSQKVTLTARRWTERRRGGVQCYKHYTKFRYNVQTEKLKRHASSHSSYLTRQLHFLQKLMHA